MNTSKIFRIIASTLCLICVIASGIIIINWFVSRQKQKDIENKVSNYITVNETVAYETTNDEAPTEPVLKYSVDFEKLCETNSDTVAWIKIEGTSIEYPVVQTNNNEYYLDHDLNKEYNVAGSIFMSYKSNSENLNTNTVLFGHNMKDGSMFAGLNTILDKISKDNYKRYKVTFITKNHYYEGYIFSAYETDPNSRYIQTEFEDKEDFNKFKKEIKNNSRFYDNIEASAPILTLSTCSTRFPGARTAIHIQLEQLK